MTDTAPPIRTGVTIPFDDLPLNDHRAWIEEIADLGYTDVSCGESDDYDGFTPLVLTSTWAPTVRLSNSIIPVFTRGPAVLAQSVASLCEIAPGRVAVGIGSSSNVIVKNWNGIAFDRPYARVRDTIRFLRAALAGEKVSEKYETFSVEGFRPRVVPSEAPPILVAALRPRMLRLAGSEGDGAVLNWASAGDIPKIAAEVGPGKEIFCRVFVVPTEDRAEVRRIGTRHMNAYLNVPVYRAFQEWLGRSEALTPMWDAWAVGDRKLATEVIPDDLLDELVISGSPDQIRAGVARYVEQGVTTVAPKFFTTDPDALRTVLQALAPVTASAPA